ncbi:hypothetical protein GALL_538420 [mine drainage metagenome]|uniref:Uncharacterized protein n=1 Tax=mine drainage metagenome TaxID=410659 RepID=A0A1J5P0J3_9ZZZZ
MENVALRVVITAVRRVDLVVDEGGQVPAVRQIRNRQFRLEGPVRVAQVGKAGRALNGAGGCVDTKAGFHNKAAGPELPGQFDGNEVGVVNAAGLEVNGLADTAHDEWLHDEGIIGRTEEGPAWNENEALHVNRRLHANLGAGKRVVDSRSGKVCLVGEHLVEHVDARRRHAGASADEHAWLRLPRNAALICVRRRKREGGHTCRSREKSLKVEFHVSP